MQSRWARFIGRWRAGHWAVAGGIFGCFCAVMLWQMLASWTGPRPAAILAAFGATSTPTATFTPTDMPSLTATPSPTATPIPSPTLEPTATPAEPPTDTPQPTPTAISTPTLYPTATPEPLPTPDGAVRALRVPILMYHYISDPPLGADAVRRDLSVSPARFEEHLRYLREAGYTAIRLYDLALALQAGHPLPEKPIILTFDDGYRDAYTEAFPLLRRYGFTATFFLLTSFIDQRHPAHLTWEQVIEMSNAGMDMEAHGYTHDDLRNRKVDFLVYQVLGAKEAIEARTHRPVRFFCYPAGKYDDQVIKVLHSAHYWGAVTVNSGTLHCSAHPFELQRVRVRGEYTAEKLGAVVELLMVTSEEMPGCTMTR